MATSAQTALPLFYKQLAVLNSREHGSWRRRTTEKLPWLARQHAVPLTVEEFAQAQRHYPIIFSTGPDPVPLALMGPEEGVNVFFREDGSPVGPVYVPAYARRYPFMLVRLKPQSTDLSLCFDPTSDLVGAFDDGEMLFEGAGPSEAGRTVLRFCEQFEIASRRTASFMADLAKHGLLMDGELAIRRPGSEKPFVYRGFQTIDPRKLRDLPAEVLSEWNRSNALSMIYAHIMSLELITVIFEREPNRRA
ncbi:MAG TPA: SapC family protein [Steroidobacter sp.]